MFETKEPVSEQATKKKEAPVSTSPSFTDLEDVHQENREPTEEEMKTLRHVSEKIPVTCWLVAVVELAERFSFYGLSAPFQNYMQNGPTDTPKGMLQLHNSGATALSYFWQFWCFVSPIICAYVSDTYYGKYKTICICTGIYIAGVFILFITSLPSVASYNLSLGGFIVAIIVIGLGTGGLKASVAPLIADQVPKNRPTIKVLKTGERVIQDPNITVQNIFMFFYLMINVGSLSILATTSLEQKVGFWAAYLLPLCFLMIAPIVLFCGNKYYIKVPVSQKVIGSSFRCCYIAMRNKFDFTTAKPSNNPSANYPWTDQFVEEVRRSMFACKVFVFYPIYWLVYGQMMSNFVSQAGQMELHGLPNDILMAINATTIIIFIPICEKFVYPFIRRFTPFKAITKIFWGFMFGAASMVYAAILQHYIYKSGPCYDMPKNCAPEFQNVPNNVHIAYQAPCYFLVGMSEILASITGLEYAYTKAPVSMKSFIMAIFLFTNAIGCALGITLAPTAQDPKLVWGYTGLACACFSAGCLFYYFFRHYNDQEDELNALEYNETEAFEITETTSKQQSFKPVLSASQPMGIR